MNRLFARAGLWSAAAVQCSFFRSRSPRVAFVLQLASGKERKREESRDGKHKGDGELNAMQCQKEREIFCWSKSCISEV